MGNVSLLRATHESDFVRTPEEAFYFWPLSLLKKPAYLGGNVFIFLGAVLFLGSPTGIVLTATNILLVDIWIRREERQLERDFREEWVRYKSQVRRWF